VHILCDAESELPIAIKVSAGNMHDVNFATPLLSQARDTINRLPKYVLADAGYSSDRIRQAIRQHFHATPVIDPNPAHKRATARTNVDEDWKALYRQRTSVERLNGRLKGFYKLNDVRVRGKMKVTLHAMLSSVVLLGSALVNPATPRSRVVA
jgi:transposase